MCPTCGGALHGEPAVVDPDLARLERARSRGPRGSRCRTGAVSPARVSTVERLRTTTTAGARRTSSATLPWVDACSQPRTAATLTGRVVAAVAAVPPRHRAVEPPRRTPTGSIAAGARACDRPQRTEHIDLDALDAAPGARARTLRAHAHRAHGGIVIGPRRRRGSRYDDPLRTGRGRAPTTAAAGRRRGSRPGFGLTELIASYNATTPVGTFIEISVARPHRHRRPRRRGTRLGRWASHDTRASTGCRSARKRDDLARVAVDTLIAHAGAPSRGWQLRVDALPARGQRRARPVVDDGRRDGVAPARLDRRPAGPERAPAIDLAVPRYSQEIHQGEYPQWNGGGEAWCSPTSTSMVLGTGTGWPEPAAVRLGQPRAIDNPGSTTPRATPTPRATTAPACGRSTPRTPARFGLDAFVTRLRSLREAELFITAGIPLVASIAFGRGRARRCADQLDRRPPRGDPRLHRRRSRVVNDPAAPIERRRCAASTGAASSRTRGRDNGGVVYVIHPRSKALPRPGPPQQLVGARRRGLASGGTRPER